MQFLSEKITTILGIIAGIISAAVVSNQLPSDANNVLIGISGVLAIILGKTHPGTPGSR